jgi:hypothetical protein
MPTDLVSLGLEPRAAKRQRGHITDPTATRSVTEGRAADELVRWIAALQRASIGPTAHDGRQVYRHLLAPPEAPDRLPGLAALNRTLAGPTAAPGGARPRCCRS